MKTIKFSKNDINLDIKFDEERKTVWMSQEEIAKLFSKSRSRVAHIIKRFSIITLNLLEYVRKTHKLEVMEKHINTSFTV